MALRVLLYVGTYYVHARLRTIIEFGMWESAGRQNKFKTTMTAVFKVSP